MFSSRPANHQLYASKASTLKPCVVFEHCRHKRGRWRSEKRARHIGWCVSATCPSSTGRGMRKVGKMQDVAYNHRCDAFDSRPCRKLCDILARTPFCSVANVSTSSIRGISHTFQVILLEHGEHTRRVGRSSNVGSIARKRVESRPAIMRENVVLVRESRKGHQFCSPPNSVTRDDCSGVVPVVTAV